VTDHPWEVNAGAVWITAPHTYVVDLPGWGAPLTPNRRRHWRHYHNAVKQIRHDTKLCVRAAQVPSMTRCELVLQVTPPDRRRRDSDNLVPYLLKPVTDAVVDAGVVPDDTDEFMSWRVELTEPGDGWSYRLLLTEGE
jgi:crossover junction endodeoxyribonuclease RusA